MTLVGKFLKEITKKRKHCSLIFILKTVGKLLLITSFGTACAPRILSFLSVTAVTCDPLSSKINAGSGTSADPYQICSVSQLEGVSDSLSAHYILKADLDMTDYSYPLFIPIGLNSGSFIGVFDGNGFTISNWLASDPSVALGLFYTLDQNASIKNLTLSNFSLSSGSQLGTLAVRMNGAVTIDHVLASGTLVSTTGQTIGGLVAVVQANPAASIQQSGFIGSFVVTATYGGYVGGLVGSANHLNFQDSFANVTMSGIILGVGFGGIGGLLGTGSLCNIHHSYSEINLNATSGGSFIGGLIGIGSAVTIESSYSKGSIVLGGVGSNQDIGGLLGLSYGYNGGPPILDSIADSYSANSMTFTNTLNPSNGIGGLVGCSGPSCQGGVAITRSYSVGNIINPGGQSGGILGSLYGGSATGGIVSSSYWDTIATGTSQDYSLSGTSGYSTSTMKDSVNYTTHYSGWDFINVWYPPTGTSYPTLR